ncbi:MAG: hypothetical protein [Microviridae sp.]|nr:MAG: hypothetical protein [Microviridae sp.]
MAYIDDKGREVLDPRPLEIPIGFERPLTLEQQIQRLMRVEYNKLAQIQSMEGVETPEEADDFDVDDDFDIFTPYENEFMPSELPAQALTDDKALTDTPAVSEKETEGATTEGRQ